MHVYLSHFPQEPVIKGFKLLCFQFSDALLYSSQGVSAANQFRIRSKIPLQAIKVLNICMMNSKWYQ